MMKLDELINKYKSKCKQIEGRRIIDRSGFDKALFMVMLALALCVLVLDLLGFFIKGQYDGIMMIFVGLLIVFFLLWIVYDKLISKTENEKQRIYQIKVQKCGFLSESITDCGFKTDDDEAISYLIEEIDSRTIKIESKKKLNGWDVFDNITRLAIGVIERILNKNSSTLTIFIIISLISLVVKMINSMIREREMMKQNYYDLIEIREMLQDMRMNNHLCSEGNTGENTVDVDGTQEQETQTDSQLLLEDRADLGQELLDQFKEENKKKEPVKSD